MKFCKTFVLFLVFFLSPCFASIKIPMQNTQTGKSVGYVLAKNTRFGLLIEPHLHDLPPGIHGFHVHAFPSCKDHGMAAHGHLDPANTGKHLGPYDVKGHLGDLPVLVVNKDGKSIRAILAPKLSLKAIENHALMIHAGGDNYSDYPEKLGGGGARIACGVVPKM